MRDAYIHAYIHVHTYRSASQCKKKKKGAWLFDASIHCEARDKSRTRKWPLGSCPLPKRGSLGEVCYVNTYAPCTYVWIHAYMLVYASACVCMYMHELPPATKRLLKWGLLHAYVRYMHIRVNTCIHACVCMPTWELPLFKTRLLGCCLDACMRACAFMSWSSTSLYIKLHNMKPICIHTYIHAYNLDRVLTRVHATPHTSIPCETVYTIYASGDIVVTNTCNIPAGMPPVPRVGIQVCMCVHVCVCIMCVHVCVRTFVCMCVHVCVCCMCTNREMVSCLLHACMYVSACMCMCVIYVHACFHTCIYKCAFHMHA
jgi:hypothetical protein